MRFLTTVILCLSTITCAGAGEAWPGVKVTYFRGANCDEEVLVTYGQEMRFDNWVPLPITGEGRRAGTGPYSVRIEADLRVDQAGDYTFRPSRTSFISFDVSVDGKPVTWTTFDQERVVHGKKRVVKVPISEPVKLAKGTVPIRFEIRSRDGRPDSRGGRDLLWACEGMSERPISPARVSVKPWPGMQRRPLLRFAMVGHSNVEGRCGGDIRGDRVIAPHAWYYDSVRRIWKPLTRTNFNHTSAITTALSLKYPDHHFGGMMLGKAASNVCDQWREGQILYLRTVRTIRNSEADGPLIAMGSHFDWDEMKKQEFIDAFEEDHADLIRRFRADLGMPKLPWIFTRVSPCFAGMGPGGKKGAKPGPDSGSPGYRKLYDAADSIAKALPPMEVVTTDDFVNNDKAPKGEGDTGPEGPMHYTQLGFRKWTARALPLLEKMGAVEAALKRLEQPVTPWPAVEELQPRWPVSEDPTEPILAVRGTITTMSTPRTPVQLRPYKDGLVVAEIAVQESTSAGDPLKLGKVLVLLPNVRDKVAQPAAAFKEGQELTVVLADWDAQPKQVHEWAVDNDFADPTRPLFYALGGAVGGDLRPGKVLQGYRANKLEDALTTSGK